MDLLPALATEHLRAKQITYLTQTVMSSNFVACCTGKDKMKTDNTNRDACDDVHKDFFCQAFFVKSGFFLLQVLFEGRFFITKPVFSFFWDIPEVFF